MDRAPGIWMRIERSDPPCSRTRTLFLPSALSRSASTHPAEPAPTITKSKDKLISSRSIRCLNRRERHIDALQLGIVLDRRFAVFAADAGTLYTAERKLDGRDVVVIDPACAGLQPGNNPVASGKILGENAGGEAVFRRVRSFDNLVFAIE